MSKSSKAGSKRSRRNKLKGHKQAHLPIRQPFTMEQLRLGLSTLPQELYNMIFDTVFTVSRTEPRYIGRTCYKPPVQLQINRRTREIFSEKYYSVQASWVFLCDWHSKPRPDTIGRWWASLDKSSKVLLCRTRPEILKPEMLVDVKDITKGKLCRYPFREPPVAWFNFWYRWLVGNKQGLGNLFEVLQFLPPSHEYDGICR